MSKYLTKKHSASSLSSVIIVLCALLIISFLLVFLYKSQNLDNRGLILLAILSGLVIVCAGGMMILQAKSRDHGNVVTDNEPEAEDQLIKDLENEKKYFASILSHDLRSPLSSIVLLTSYIKSKDANSETMRYIELIEQSARKELEMMATLLALMRAESFKADHAEEVKIDQLIRETLQNAEPQLAKKSLTTTVDIAPDLSLSADPQNLNLILKSLISQAICYSDTGQTIEIKASQDGKTVAIEAAVLSEELLKNTDKELFRSDHLDTQNTGNAFPDCVHLYFLVKAIRNYNGTIHVQRDGNNPASRFILTLERQPPQHTA